MLATQLRDALAGSAVAVSVQRRGRDPQPGRPDSVLWLRPASLPVDHVVPILVELEGAGNFHASKVDIDCFAGRQNPVNRPPSDDFRYHLEFPVADLAFAASLPGNGPGTDFRSRPAPVTIPVTYELFTVASKSVTGERATSDARLHQALCNRYDTGSEPYRSPPGFSSDATVVPLGATEIVVWEVEWRLPDATTGTIAVPFVVDPGDDVEDVFRSPLAAPRIPTMVVLDGSVRGRSETITHQTGVQFPPLAPASVTAATRGGDC